MLSGCEKEKEGTKKNSCDEGFDKKKVNDVKAGVERRKGRMAQGEARTKKTRVELVASMDCYFLHLFRHSADSSVVTVAHHARTHTYWLIGHFPFPFSPPSIHGASDGGNCESTKPTNAQVCEPSKCKPSLPVSLMANFLNCFHLFLHSKQNHAITHKANRQNKYARKTHVHILTRLT